MSAFQEKRKQADKEHLIRVAEKEIEMIRAENPLGYRQTPLARLRIKKAEMRIRSLKEGK